MNAAAAMALSRVFHLKEDNIVTQPIPRLAIVVAAIAIIGYGIGFDAAEQDAEMTYDVRPLESLGGSSSRGHGVNDWGLVAGFSNLTGNAARRATLWFHDRKFTLEPLGGTNSTVPWTGLKNNGLVVGVAQTDKLQTRKDGWSCRIFFPGPDNAKYTCLGVIWEWGKKTPVPLPTLGGNNGFAASANTRQQVVGWAETTVQDSTCVNPEDLQFHAVLWDLNRNQTVELLPYGNDSSGAATAISDRGHVVGISGDCDQSVGRKTARHAVLWKDGTVKDLGSLGADTWNTPTAITKDGDIVVGFANAPGAEPNSPKFRAWLWTEREDITCSKLPGTDICDLGTLDDGSGTAQAWGVNERGQVVGQSCSLTGTCRAFLWENGVMKELNMLKGSYPHFLLDAMDINNLGQITGRAQISSTDFEAFIATPAR
jgi:probable HAF family extracellular repeat protein